MGFVLFWFGMAALVVGVLTFIVPEIGWPWQVTLFAVLAAGFIVMWWRWRAANPKAPDEAEQLNHRANGLIGTVITLSEPLHLGQGRTFINDTLWQVRGPEAPSGAEMRVTGVSDDAVLELELASPGG